MNCKHFRIYTNCAENKNKFLKHIFIGVYDEVHNVSIQRYIEKIQKFAPTCFNFLKSRPLLPLCFIMKKKQLKRLKQFLLFSTMHSKQTYNCTILCIELRRARVSFLRSGDS
jgi:hypothetical protein